MPCFLLVFLNTPDFFQIAINSLIFFDFRYIPFRRFLLPLGENENLEVAQSEKLMPLLLDEIGSGASGSVVRKCSLGTITVAAKVRTSMSYQNLLQYFMH